MKFISNIASHTEKMTKLTYFLASLAMGLFFGSTALIVVSGALLLLILFEKYLNIKIPIGMAEVFVGFIVFSLVLGSYWNFYERFLRWDDLLHAFYGGAFAFLGFLVIYYISKKRGIENEVLIICMFSFCFAVAFGAIREIYEFAYDILLDGNMQRTDQGSGVTDTMNDIILESSAAFIVNIYIYAYLKYGGNNRVKKLTEKFMDMN